MADQTNTARNKPNHASEHLEMFCVMGISLFFDFPNHLAKTYCVTLG